MSEATSGTSRQQVIFDTEINPDLTPMFASAPTELVLAEPMPEVCSEHGLPAGESRACSVNSSGPLSELPTARSFLRSMAPGQRAPLEARVRFECPACEYCLHEVRRFRRIAVVALLAIPLTIAAIITARSLGLDQFYLPLAFAVVPGCMPIALLVAVLAWSRSGFFADVWMNQDADQLIVSAHPDFAAAVERNRAETR
ncbi:hypothetical protein ACFU44_08305 [Nocardia rhizosphaerihabitans]|uniref:hypothetical protein n=1 Tax=Nocardia rhizosphaerihabitans TaxID=1691570 RepID=UPI00366C838C